MAPATKVMGQRYNVPGLLRVPAWTRDLVKRVQYRLGISRNEACKRKDAACIKMGGPHKAVGRGDSTLRVHATALVLNPARTVRRYDA